MRIGIVGFGEVGQCFASALAPLAEPPLALCDPTPTPAATALADRLNVEIADGVHEGLVDCDLLVGCAEGTATDAIADRVASLGKPGQVLFDLATAAPQVKRAAAERLDAAGQRYVDAAIMGAIAIHGIATPLLAAGPADDPAVARSGEMLRQAGCRLDWLAGGRPGDAASLKLLRSVFTKGMEALAVECLVAAEHFRVREALYAVLSDVDATPLPAFLEMLVTTHLLHAGRRLSEIEQAEGQLRQAGLPVRLLPSVRALFADTAEAQRHHPPTAAAPLDETLRRLREIAAGPASAA